MAHISIRISNSEKLKLERYAKFCGESVSDLIRRLFREELEDYEDLKAIEEYENSDEYEKGGIPFEQAMK